MKANIMMNELQHVAMKMVDCESSRHEKDERKREDCSSGRVLFVNLSVLITVLEAT